MLKRIIKKINKKFGPSLSYSPAVQKSFCNATVTGWTLEGKKVMITGATGDIGKALVKRFVLEHACVIMVARSENKLLSLVKEFDEINNIDYLVCDISDFVQLQNCIESYFEKKGPVDILINNAGILGGAREKHFRGVSKDVYFSTINTNLKSSIKMSDMLINKLLQENKAGTIINMSSICSRFNSFSYSPYGISKAGLFGLTEEINAKYHMNNITAHAILPGSVATKMGNLGVGDNIAGNNNILNRPAIPEEIAAIAAILSSDIGKYCRTELIASAGEKL